MKRRKYIVTYDISDDKRRTKVFNLLHGFGDHAQYSVFFCQLSKMELLQLKGRMSPLINNREDQILIVDLGPSSTPMELSIDCLGKAYAPPTRVFII